MRKDDTWRNTYIMIKLDSETVTIEQEWKKRFAK